MPHGVYEEPQIEEPHRSESQHTIVSLWGQLTVSMIRDTVYLKKSSAQHLYRSHVSALPQRGITVQHNLPWQSNSTGKFTLCCNPKTASVRGNLRWRSPDGTGNAKACSNRHKCVQSVLVFCEVWIPVPLVSCLLPTWESASKCQPRFTHWKIAVFHHCFSLRSSRFAPPSWNCSYYYASSNLSDQPTALAV